MIYFYFFYFIFFESENSGFSGAVGSYGGGGQHQWGVKSVNTEHTQAGSDSPTTSELACCTAEPTDSPGVTEDRQSGYWNIGGGHIGGGGVTSVVGGGHIGGGEGVTLVITEHTRQSTYWNIGGVTSVVGGGGHIGDYRTHRQSRYWNIQFN